MLGNDGTIREFWKWFQRHESHLRNFPSHPEKYLDEILENLAAIRPGLAVELEPPEDGIIRMTVSANGDRELFPEVEAIVAEAPRLEDWKFIAFRQRMAKDKAENLVLKNPGFELDPNLMRFEPIVSEDGLDIIVFASGITEGNYHQAANAALILLDNLLGEFDCVTKVRSYDFHALPADKEEAESLMPLLEIADYVDAYHAKGADPG